MDSNYITASFDTLLDQSAQAPAFYLRSAQYEIDKVFGEGYASKNPALVAAYIKAASADMSAATLGKILGASLQEISQSLNSIADSMEK